MSQEPPERKAARREHAIKAYCIAEELCRELLRLSGRSGREFYLHLARALRDELYLALGRDRDQRG